MVVPLGVGWGQGGVESEARVHVDVGRAGPAAEPQPARFESWPCRLLRGPGPSQPRFPRLAMAEGLGWSLSVDRTRGSTWEQAAEGMITALGGVTPALSFIRLLIH